MPLTAQGLADAITAAQGTPPTTQGQTIQSEANLQLATAIVNYLKANTTITIPSLAVAGGGGGATPATTITGVS